jgi:hypothetical protein
MPCLLLILFAAFPRVALVLLFLFSNYLQRAAGVSRADCAHSWIYLSAAHYARLCLDE